MAKKICSFILAIAVLMSVIAVSVFAESDATEQTSAVVEARMQKLLVVNNMEAQDGYNVVNVCAAIDTLGYNEVGFKVTVVDLDEEYETQSTTLTTDTVYSTMTVTNAAGGETTYTGTDLNGNYIFGCKVMLNAEQYTNANTKLVIVPYAIDLEGNEILGKQITLTDSIIKDKNSNSALFRD